MPSPAQNLKIETYLTSLENLLRPLPVSDRAEIVTEIKSHILSALERSPDLAIDSVLDGLGLPEVVARRYLSERGVTEVSAHAVKPPIHPIVKWILIGGALLIVLGFVLSIVLFKVARVSSHGIPQDIKDWSEGFSAKHQNFTMSVDAPENQAVRVQFGNANIEFSNSPGRQLKWECASSGSSQGMMASPPPAADGHPLTLDFRIYPWLKCEISVPENLKLTVEGANGKVEFNRPHYEVNAEMANGKVDINPDSAKRYRYNVTMINGSADAFSSSPESSANDVPTYAINVHLQNGKISRGD